MPCIASIGEVMVELASSNTSNPLLKSVSYAGDTYNTAVTLSRLGLTTDYITRLGHDPYSEDIITRLEAEAIGTTAITRSKKKVPGLYMIHNSPTGERDFFYWRSQAAARTMFNHASFDKRMEEQLLNYDWIYFSGITLAILTDEGRDNFYTFLKRFKTQGGKIAFDSNYRPRLWEQKKSAQEATIAALKLTNIALLTLDDEELLWGDSKKNALQAANARYQNFTIDEIIYKRGAEDVIIISKLGEQRVEVPKVNHIIDTTAAGDTFNAGYLAERLKGSSAIEAAKEASLCARIIIQHRGGVIAKDIFLKEYNKLKSIQ